MLADPVTITASSPTPQLDLSVVSWAPGGMGSVRKDVPDGYTLNISHTTDPKKGDRHYMQIQLNFVGVDPVTGGSANLVASASISASFPPFGMTDTTRAAVVKAVMDTMLDSEVTVLKWVQFQS